MDTKEKYFVVSTGDFPEGIYFTLIEAQESLADYIDSFNKAGEHVESYKRVNGEYTTDF